MVIDDTPEDFRPGLNPPRFRLGSLMWAFVFLGAIFALMSYLGSHATLLAILFALAIVAHVAGNCLGTQLRRNGDTPVASATNRTKPRVQKPTPQDFAPTTRLRQRTSLGRPIVIVTGLGTLLGGLLGGSGLLLLIPIESSLSSLSSLALGAAAAGVLGGIWTFLAMSFLQVAGGALWQATREIKNRSP